MKKIRFISMLAAAVAVGACTSDELVDKGGTTQISENTPLGFNVKNKNMTRAGETLESKGVYSFGVYAYKNPDAPVAVMENYLVGYYGRDLDPKAGYDAEASSVPASTIGDKESAVNGLSMWYYEGLGKSQYNKAENTGTDEYILKTDADKMSQNNKQYLKYWDKSSASTSFFAYTPYDNGAVYDAGTDNGKLTLAKTINSGWSAGSEVLWAANRVAKADYDKDVPLAFKHSGAKIQIAFYEDIKGYDVEVLNLGYKVNAAGDAKSALIEGTPVEFVKGETSVISETRKSTTSPYANAYTQNVTKYEEVGELVSSLSSVVFTNVKNADAATISTTGGTKVALTPAAGGTKDPYADIYYLGFAKPKADDANIEDWGGDETIGTKKTSQSPSVYYAVPGANDGFIIHVSFVLKAKDGDEKIYIQDATAYVAPAYTTWQANKVYTYIFKITDKAKGWPSTSKDGIGVDPVSREIPTDNSLNPIVFDGITIADYDEEEIVKEFVIND